MVLKPNCAFFVGMQGRFKVIGYSIAYLIRISGSSFYSIFNFLGLWTYQPKGNIIQLLCCHRLRTLEEECNFVGKCCGSIYDSR